MIHEITSFKVLPHICQKKNGIIDVVSKDGVNVGDILDVDYEKLANGKNVQHTISEVIESRQARGELTGERPVWSRVRI